MPRIGFGQRKLWQHAHSLAILFAVLMFTAGFLCVLLWTNGIVATQTSEGGWTETFTAQSPAVSTFSLTYGTAIFGTIWNSVGLVALLILERDVLPISTDRLRYEVEKSACVVFAVGNAIYALACIAIMSTLARLAADATQTQLGNNPTAAQLAVAASALNRRAGQGTTAAFAGLAGITAWLAGVMDIMHMQRSTYRQSVIGPSHNGAEGEKTA